MTSTRHPSTDGADQAAHQPSRQGAGGIGLLVCGMVAGPLFFAIFSIAGALRSNYDPLRHPISSLMFGSGGWVQSVNFLLTGTLVTLFGWGFGHRFAPWAVAVRCPYCSSRSGLASSAQACSLRIP